MIEGVAMDEERTMELALEQDFEALLAKGTEVVSTDELAEGDIVLHYGMVIKLGAPQVFQGFSQRAVYHLPGQVQNMAEIFRPGHVTWGLLKADGSWPIQGNSMATWTRVSRRPSVMEAWEAAWDEQVRRETARARELDVWLVAGVVLVDPMLENDLMVFERWGAQGAEVRNQRTGALHVVSQSYITTWKYVPRPIELNQVWRSKETGDLVRIVDTSRDDVRLIGLDAEDVPFWLSRSMLAGHFVWAP